MAEPRATKLWAGRLGASTSGLVERYTSSVDVDRRLHDEDITQSLVHARMLHRVGLIDAATLRAIATGLERIAQEFSAGAFAFAAADEDIHSAIKRRLHEVAGDASGALQTGRSRNDQVATNLRMFSRRACVQLCRDAVALQHALLRQADDHRDTVMPAYTHLQRAQPVTVAHHLLAYVEMLQRDVERLLDARRRGDVLPLGSGAVAGSTLPLDRELTARELGFAAISRNSIDSVSDRDFAVEITSACALLMVHCSRLAEEIVVWMSREFGFVTLPDSHATGSSLMPQKKNPDVAELARGRAARVIGDVVTLLTLVKGLPLSYNRDLQEDKRPLFDAVDTASATLVVLADVVSVMRFDTDELRRAASDPELMATDAAEHLVQQGVPFREAHEIVGSLVRQALAGGRTLRDLTLDDWHEASPQFTPAVLALFDVDAAVRRRRTAGGPAPDSVATEVVSARERLQRTIAELDRLR